MSTAVWDELSRALGSKGVSQSPDDLETYGRDWTRVHLPRASGVVFPRTTVEVAEVVRICRQHRVAIVPSGGRTGLAAGAVATRGEVVLSTERMKTIHEVDLSGLTVRVQAGAVTALVHERVGAHGLTWPVDFASKGSSHVGGNIATNAGGVKVIRYGLTRQWVLGLTVVTGAGEILELNGALEKNNTGIDLRQLFVGSEGSLGVITEAVLKLTPLPKRLHVALLAIAGLEGVLETLRYVRQGPFTVSAFEMFTDRCLARLQRHRGLRSPLSSQSTHYALVEFEDADRERLEPWLFELMESDLLLDGTLAADREQATRLWELREGISESLSATGHPHKNDIALPVAALAEFCQELEKLFLSEYPDYEVCLFGHIGDGNLHVNVMKPDALSIPMFLERIQAAETQLFELVQRYRGSVSAEHGIGLLKRQWLPYTRSQRELSLMKALKHVFDPDGILNPGKVFDG